MTSPAIQAAEKAHKASPPVTEVSLKSMKLNGSPVHLHFFSIFIFFFYASRRHHCGRMLFSRAIVVLLHRVTSLHL